MTWNSVVYRQFGPCNPCKAKQNIDITEFLGDSTDSPVHVLFISDIHFPEYNHWFCHPTDAVVMFHSCSALLLVYVEDSKMRDAVLEQCSCTDQAETLGTASDFGVSVDDAV